MRANHYFLILTAVCAVFGFTAGDSIYSELGRPFAGIFFGLFLITTVFQKESDLFDEQLAERQTPEPHAPRQSLGIAKAEAPSFTDDPSHRALLAKAWARLKERGFSFGRNSARQ